MACAPSIPIIPLSTACQANVGISGMTGQVPHVPSVNLQVNISIPIKELLQALSQISVPTVPMVPGGSCGSCTRSQGNSKDSSLDGKQFPLPEVTVPAVPAVIPFAVLSNVSNVSNVSRISRVSSLTQPTSATPVTSEPPFGVSGPWELAPGRPGPGRCSVRVSNLLKRMSSQHLKQAFGHHVGPVFDCRIEKGSALLTFSDEDARKAVDRYHGGLLEITETKTNGGDDGDVISLWPNAATIECLQAHLGPLSKCSLRGGEEWVTLFVSSRAQQLKHERGQSSIDFKGTFISVCLDAGASGASGASGDSGALSQEHISFLKGFPVDL